MDGCYIPNNPSFSETWRPLSPTCGQPPILNPLKPLTAPSPPMDPPPAYPPTRTPEAPTNIAMSYTPSTSPIQHGEHPDYTNTTASMLEGDPNPNAPSVMGGILPPLFDNLEPLPNFVTLSPHTPYK